MALRICLDANVLLRAIAAPSGPQSTIVLQLLGRSPHLQLVTSVEIVREWRTNATKRSVERYFLRRGVGMADYIEVLEDLVRVAEFGEPVGEPPPCRDEDDRKYLHLGEFAGLQYLITADIDLLEVGVIGSCRIVTAHRFLTELA